MNRYKLSKAGISANEGIKRFNGSAEIYEKCLLQFLSDNNYQNMLKALAESQVKEAFAAAHALKGIAGNLSMKRLYEDIFPLVEELRAESLEKADNLLPAVSKDYEDIIAALR